MTDAEVHAARRLVKDETFQKAVAKHLDRLSKQLFAATTPEDREQKFQEHSGLRRVVNDLEVTASTRLKTDAQQ